MCVFLKIIVGLFCCTANDPIIHICTFFFFCYLSLYLSIYLSVYLSISYLFCFSGEPWLIQYVFSLNHVFMRKENISWETDVVRSQVFQTLYFSIISLISSSAYNLGRRCPGATFSSNGGFFPQSFFSLGFCHEEPDMRRELSKYLSKYLWTDINEYRVKNRTFFYSTPGRDVRPNKPEQILHRLNVTFPTSPKSSATVSVFFQTTMYTQQLQPLFSLVLI